MLKLNVDAAVCPGRDFCGVSAVIRDCEENVLGAVVKEIEGHFCIGAGVYCYT